MKDRQTRESDDQVAGPDEIGTLVLAGELDAHDVPWITEALAALAARDTRRVAVDLGAVTFVDSAVLVALLGAAKDMRRHGGWLRIVNANGLPMRLLTLTRAEGTGSDGTEGVDFSRPVDPAGQA
jgi:anti-anti-sigma factor